MKFTAKVFTLTNSTSKLKGFAKVTIDDLVTMDGFKIFEGPKGLFVGVPSQKSAKPSAEGKDQYFDQILFTDTSEEDPRSSTSPTFQAISEAILEEYSRSKSMNARQGAAKAQAGAAKRAKPVDDDEMPW